MNDKNYNKAGGGMGICGTLFVVFLVLKLTGAISWSWWWVTAPLWIPMLPAAVVILLFLLLLVFTEIFS